MATYKCAHCGLVAGDLAGGYAGVSDADGKLARVCHPNATGRPDCYRRITVYREPLGALLDADPKPDGLADRRPVEDDKDWLNVRGALADVWDGEPAEVTIRRQRDEGWD